MSKKSHLRWSIERQHGKRAETLIQSERQLLYHIHWSLRRWLSWKESLVVTCKVARLFVNTLTADDKYSLLSRDNSMQTIQMQLWQKQKSFSEFIFCISQIYIKFSTFSEIDELDRLYFSGVTDPQRRG